MNNPTENNGIQRGPDPDLTDQRRALVTRLIDDVKKAKERHRTAFARMRDDMKFVRKQLPMEMENDDRTKVNIVQRFLNTRVAVLYAKSPTFIAQTRKRMDFTIWDGKRASLQAAAQAEAQAQQQGMPPPPGVMELMADVQQGLARRELMSSIGRTLEIALTYSLDEQQPPFKAQAKQLVRRTITCGVGYAKLSFQRELAKRPDTEASLPDITDRVSTVERLSADLADGKSDPGSADAEELNLAKGSLTAERTRSSVRGWSSTFPQRPGSSLSWAVASSHPASPAPLPSRRNSCSARSRSRKSTASTSAPTLSGIPRRSTARPSDRPLIRVSVWRGKSTIGRTG
jgi:hypothetical protein